METKFNYSVSDKTEYAPIGHIKYLYPSEVIEYYSEKELLNDYKNAVYNEGINAVKVKINGTKNNPRHGLNYEILREEANEYGVDYTKEEYERAYKKSLINKKYER
jgi:hypothetical protein